jgi:hypothetical protein
MTELGEDVRFPGEAAGCGPCLVVQNLDGHGAMFDLVSRSKDGPHPSASSAAFDPESTVQNRAGIHHAGRRSGSREPE